MAEYKTPGVYIVEHDAFPNSVVEVPTAVPAFIGYTEKARSGTKDLTGKPTRITSYGEYQQVFGGAPEQRISFKVEDDKPVLTWKDDSRFLLEAGMRLFFANGGGPCWVVSVGGYGTVDKPTKKTAQVFIDPLAELEKEPEPTAIVTPDTVLLSRGDHAKVAQAVQAHCAKMQSRMAILDVHDGHLPRTGGDDDVISGVDGFRNGIGTEGLQFGAAYYPWLNTSLFDATYSQIDDDDRSALSTWLADQAKADAAPRETKAELLSLIGEVAEHHSDPKRPKQIHIALKTALPAYVNLMKDMAALLNLQPPSAAMAGVWTMVDNTLGVWKAPANVSVGSVVSPAVEITSEQQEDLNAPLDGKAVNAIRTFTGRGVLVWGARTLDANSQDWRYINVRRTMIMLEQSIKVAAEAYVFAPNDASTWVTVKSMIENFLTNQWKAGALAGTKPADAFDVAVGLGSTMTGNDILDGYMRVTVRVAVTRPAEFIVITFQQKMQTS